MCRRNPQFLSAFLVSGFLILAVILLSVSVSSTAAAISGSPHPDQAAPFAEVSLPVVQSAYTNQDDPYTNFGGQPEMHAGTSDKSLGRHFIYLKFDLSSIPTGSRLSTARLRLFQESATGPNPYWIWPWSVPGPWSEGLITWNNQPWPSTPSGTAAGIPPGAGWQEWDVYAIVDQWLAGAPAYGIVLAGDNTTIADHLFDGRTGKVPPELVIQYKPPDTSTPTATFTYTPRPPTDTPTPTVKPTKTATPTPTQFVKPTNTPTRTPTPSPTPTEVMLPDIRIVGMEITQGTQNLLNQMPLERWRETVVRAYIFSTSPVPNVSARLRAFRPSGAELLPAQNSLWPVSTHPGAIDRLNIRDGFYFYLPVAWREGSIRFRLEVNPGNVIPETNYANNILERSIEFEPGNFDEAIAVRGFDAEDLQGRTYNVTDPRIQPDTLQPIRRYFPTLRLFTMGDTDPLGELFWCSFEHGRTTSGMNCMAARVAWWANHTSDDYPHQHYAGLVHPDDDMGYGGLGAVGGQDLWAFVTRSANPAWYIAGPIVHELGHNHGLDHVNCAGLEDWGGTHPEWVDLRYPWPFPNCRIAEVDVWGFYGLDIQHAVAGLPGPTVFTNDPHGPSYNVAWPLMGYSSPRWISPWELCEFLPAYGIPCILTFGGSASTVQSSEAHAMAVYANPAAYAPEKQIAELLAAGDYIQVHGRAWRDGKSAELWHVQRTTQPVEKAVQEEIGQQGKMAALAAAADVPSLTVEQLDSSGAVLSSKPVYIAEITEPVEWLSFTELLPRAAGAVRVRLVSGGLPLAERAATKNAPQVTILAPAGGSFGPGSTVNWQGSDADGDKLYYDVLFTPDGTTWQVLEQDLEGMSITVKSTLKGTKAGRIAVIANDGFWSTTALSEPLIVANNPPQPLITAPQDGDSFLPGSLVVLTGQAYDPEDKTIPDGQLTWSVTPGAQTGNGGELPLWNLAPGTYSITLMATDSAGLQASRSITITVAEKKLYLPLTLRQ